MIAKIESLWFCSCSFGFLQVNVKRFIVLFFHNYELCIMHYALSLRYALKRRTWAMLKETYNNKVSEKKRRRSHLPLTSYVYQSKKKFFVEVFFIS